MLEKCVVKEIKDSKIIKNFLNSNHLQGYTRSEINIGLYYENELVSVMTFGHKRVVFGYKDRNDNQYEMIRFCNLLSHRVIGGASKLFKYFISKYNPESIISYADKRISNGNIYEKLKFKKIRESKPGYSYVNSSTKRWNRFLFTKKRIQKMFNDYDENLSQHQNMLKHNYFKIYDCGQLVFLYEKI